MNQVTYMSPCLSAAQIYKLQSFSLLLLERTARVASAKESRMGTTGKTWKSDDFRKFMKVRLHNSFPRCDALCSRDVVTWNLRPLPLFSREPAARLVIQVCFLRVCVIQRVSRIVYGERRDYSRSQTWTSKCVSAPRRKYRSRCMKSLVLEIS